MNKEMVTVQIPLQDVVDRYIGIRPYMVSFPMRHLNKDGHSFFTMEVSDGHVLNNENVLRFVLKNNNTPINEVLLSCDQILNQSQMIVEILASIKGRK